MRLEGLQGGEKCRCGFTGWAEQCPLSPICIMRMSPVGATDLCQGPAAWLCDISKCFCGGKCIARDCVQKGHFDFCLWIRHCRTPVPFQLGRVNLYRCRAKIIISLHGNSASLVSAPGDFLRSYVSTAKTELMAPGWVLHVRVLEDARP